MNLRHHLTEPLAYLAPASLVAGLDPSLAARRVPGAPHTIAELVAHVDYWQQWFLAHCQGRSAPMPEHAAGGWPAADAEAWPALEARFNVHRETLAEIAAGDLSAVVPGFAGTPLEGYTVADALAHAAIHQAHHLGQVVLLRQMLGAWPPPAGSWTW